MIGTAIKNREAELTVFRARALFAGFCVLVAFAILAGRMVYLQVSKHGHFHTLAEANRISVVPVVHGTSRAGVHTSAVSISRGTSLILA